MWHFYNLLSLRICHYFHCLLKVYNLIPFPCFFLQLFLINTHAITVLYIHWYCILTLYTVRICYKDRAIKKVYIMTSYLNKFIEISTQHIILVSWFNCQKFRVFLLKIYQKNNSDTHKNIFFSQLSKWRNFYISNVQFTCNTK